MNNNWNDTYNKIIYEQEREIRTEAELIEKKIIIKELVKQLKEELPEMFGEENKMEKLYLKNTTNNNMKKYIGQVGYIRMKETVDKPHLQFISLVTNDWIFETSGVQDISRFNDELIYNTRNSTYRFGML